MTVGLGSLEHIQGVEALSTCDQLYSHFLSQIIGKYESQLSSDQIVGASAAEYYSDWPARFPSFCLRRQDFIEAADCED